MNISMDKVILAITVSLLLASAAADITFDPVQPSYLPGPATFSFTVTNTIDSTVELSVSALIFLEKDRGYIESPVYSWDATLIPGASESYEIPFTISDIAESGKHIIAVSVEGDLVETATQDFNVIGTKLPLSITAVACSDTCDSYTTAFLLSESPITIKVLDSEGTNIIGELKTPSGDRNFLNFANGLATFAIEEEGTYVIDVSARKEGYADDSDTLEIVTMKELPKVIYDTPCNANGDCDGAETRQNCPMDCLPGEVGPYSDEEKNSEVGKLQGDEKSNNSYMPASDGIDWIMIIILTITLLIVVLILKSRKKN